MKAIRYSAFLLLVAVATGCSSTFYAFSEGYSDDLYGTHDRTAIARYKQAEAEAEAARAEAEARKAQWEAMIAEAEAQAAQEDYEQYDYSSVLVDTYEGAYARRLKGFRSLSYRMPSSYYDLRYSPEYQYLTAYDPMNYNIVVMGDEVWVEPKYISSMFGTWGSPGFSLTIGSGGWYGGFYYDWLWPSNYYYSWWGYPRYSWWDYNYYWYCGWPLYGPMWPTHGPHYPHHPGGGGGPHHPDYPHYANYRPAPGGSTPAGVRPSSPYHSPRGNYNYRGGATLSGGNNSNYRGTARPGSQTTTTGREGNYRTSKPASTAGSSGNTTSRPSYTGPGSSNYRSKEGNSRREESYSPFRNNSSNSSSNNSSGGNYRSNYNSGASSSGSNYRSSGSGGGNYRSSGGGNYRGR